MKARLSRHFGSKDPVVAGIVALSEQYGLTGDTPLTVFQTLTRSIAGQQLSGVVARRILDRLAAMHEGRLPSPSQIAAATPEALRAIGFSFAKIAALKDLAAHCLDGRLPEDATLAGMDDEAIIERCIAVRGVGRWTVQMLLMFHFGRHDVMPVDDFGVRNGFRLAYGLKGMPKPKALLAYAERWKPWRSAASWYMWRAVDLHREGKLPKRVGRMPRIEVVLPREKPRSRKAAKVVRPAKATQRARRVRKAVSPVRKSR